MDAQYNFAGAGLKKTVSLKQPSSCTTAEHLYRQAGLMFLFYVALLKGCYYKCSIINSLIILMTF